MQIAKKKSLIMHHNANRKKKKKKNWACAFFCLLAGFLSFGVMGHCWCIMHLMHIMHIILGNGINSVNVVNVVNVIIFDTSCDDITTKPVVGIWLEGTYHLGTHAHI